MSTETIYQVKERKRKHRFRELVGVCTKKSKANDADDYSKQYEAICERTRHISNLYYYYHHFIGPSMDNSLLTATHLSSDLNNSLLRLNELSSHLIRENAVIHHDLIKIIRKARKQLGENIDLLEGSARDHGSAAGVSVVDTLPTEVQKHILSFIFSGTFGKRTQNSSSTLHRFFPSNGTIRRNFKFLTGKSTLDFLREVDLMRYHNLKGDKEDKMLDYITPTRFTSPVIILTDSRNVSSVETAVASAFDSMVIS
jgi:hypothetical protein